MIKTSFEEIMERVVHGSTQKAESEKLRKLAQKITKVPATIKIPSEYLVKKVLIK